jgi:ABC-type glycerol-3-phosphate transport system substrate-binding protein
MGKSMTGTIKGAPPVNAEVLDWLATAIGTGRPPADTAVLQPPKPASEPEAKPTRTGTPVPPAKQINLKIYVNWEAEDLRALESLIDDYCDLHPNVTFDLITAREQDLIETVMAAGDADLLLWSGLDIPRWAENNLIVPLSEYVNAG